jgi:hypothetical protein
VNHSNLVIFKMDFLEMHQFLYRHEMQCMHWSAPTAAILVFVIYRHAVMSVDGVDSTQDHAVIIKEEVYGISDDTKHDGSYLDFFMWGGAGSAACPHRSAGACFCTWRSYQCGSRGCSGCGWAWLRGA